MLGILGLNVNFCFSIVGGGGGGNMETSTLLLLIIFNYCIMFSKFCCISLILKI